MIYQTADEEIFEPKSKEIFLKLNTDGVRVKCPCCSKVYNTLFKRKIYKAMKNALLLLYKRNNVASANSIGDFTKLSHFGLVVKTDSGHWFVTPLGESFINGKTSVPKYVFLRNNNVEGYSEEEIFFNDI